MNNDFQSNNGVSNNNSVENTNSTNANIPIVNPSTNINANINTNTSTSTSVINANNDDNTNLGASVSAVSNSNVSNTNPVDTSSFVGNGENSSFNGTSLNVSPTNQNNNTNKTDNLQNKDSEYVPPSKAKIAFMIFSFVVLLAFVIFLPEITTMINLYKSGSFNKIEENITTGSMKCNLVTNTSNLDKNYDLLFRFTDNKLEKTEFVITTKGDPSADEEVLDNLASSCEKLEEGVTGVSGVSISCNYSTGKLVERQLFDLANIDLEILNSAFAEVGGNYPEYKFGQDMDLVERSMKASGYTCVREK